MFSVPMILRHGNGTISFSTSLANVRMTGRLAFTRMWSCKEKKDSVFYFTHPGRVNGHHEDSNSYELRRSSIQVAKLEVVDGVLICDRDKEFELKLGADDR